MTDVNPTTIDKATLYQSDLEGFSRVAFKTQPFETAEQVIAEKDDLDGKIERLVTFMSGETFETLPDAERSDMHLQIGAMQEYSDILASRLYRLESA